ncbi:hypothetical protein HJG60_008208 [Phyllostomus discolor]|uniref:Uncharacterized protein n=1 Tax=Phyllostomus discolor TaxID=89673 RepID=A0A833Z6J1_9CHIR|nr:hypothetical protein HJG60_008208 [Phyllostomus discolor]
MGCLSQDAGISVGMTAVLSSDGPLSLSTQSQGLSRWSLQQSGLTFSTAARGSKRPRQKLPEWQTIIFTVLCWSKESQASPDSSGGEIVSSTQTLSLEGRRVKESTTCLQSGPHGPRWLLGNQSSHLKFQPARRKRGVRCVCPPFQDIFCKSHKIFLVGKNSNGHTEDAGGHVSSSFWGCPSPS